MIIVAGEALVDLVIEPDGTVTAALGGAPFNTARAAARLGADVDFVGTLSNDRFGCMLADRLATDGVGLAAPRTELPTTLAAAELDDNGAATYRFYVEATSAPALAADASTAVAADGDALFTGGLGLVFEPMASTIAALVDDATVDTLVMIDVNCRPKIIDDRDTYLARIAQFVRRADIVKVSDDDLAYLSPGRTIIDAAHDLLGHGAGAVLVTAGSSHTSIVVGDEVIDVPVAVLCAPVVDTIGAGDTFAGSLLAWWAASGLSRGDVDAGQLERGVAAAHAAAGIVVTRRGADPPHRSDLPDDWA